MIEVVTLIFFLLLNNVLGIRVRLIRQFSRILQKAILLLLRL